MMDLLNCYSKQLKPLLKAPSSLLGSGFFNLNTFMMEKIKLKRHPETNEIIHEKWKNIKGYGGKYKVSNYGRIKSLKRKWAKNDKILKGAVKINVDKRRTYHYVHLTNGIESKVHYTHQLVADAFLEEIDGKDIINHKDLDKLNNFYLNLERCTQRENIIHAYKNGAMKYDLIPEEEKQRRLDNRRYIETSREEFYEIKEKYSTGEYTQYDLADEYNKDQSCISRMLKRDKYWK